MYQAIKRLESERKAEMGSRSFFCRKRKLSGFLAPNVSTCGVNPKF